MSFFSWFTTCIDVGPEGFTTPKRPDRGKECDFGMIAGYENMRVVAKVSRELGVHVRQVPVTHRTFLRSRLSVYNLPRTIILSQEQIHTLLILPKDTSPSGRNIRGLSHSMTTQRTNCLWCSFAPASSINVISSSVSFGALNISRHSCSRDSFVVVLHKRSDQPKVRVGSRSHVTASRSTHVTTTTPFSRCHKYST